MNAKTSMEAIKAKLRENAEKKNGQQQGTKSSGDNTYYQFWNIPYNTSALIRYLPDGDPDNVFFWVKKETISLPFEGIVGGDPQYETSEPTEVKVPCIDMFGMSCPITAHIRPWWKDEDKKPLARVYYKKPAFIFQGFVVQSPFEETELPENPIRKFSLNRSLFEIVEQSLANPEMEDNPTDFVAGRDFKLTKTQRPDGKGGHFANYATSTWSFRTRSLDEREAIAIEQFGLSNLSEAQGRRPDADEVEMIKAMFHDSLDGKPFDAHAYGHLYRAYKKRGNNEDNVVAAARAAHMSTATSAQVPQNYGGYSSAPAPQAPVAPTVTETAPAPAAPAAPAGGAPGDRPSAHDILERIKNRSNPGAR